MAKSEIYVTSTLDGSVEPSVFFRCSGEGRHPLLVGLHSWSCDRFQEEATMLPYAEKYGFDLLLPEFRGPNLDRSERCTQACASEYARQDIADAVYHLIREGYTDEENVFLLGCSGGGHMALMTAAFFSTLFKAVASFVPITDLNKWQKQCERYRPHVLACCSNDEVEMAKRSPISYVDELARANLKIFHGKFDPLVPVAHSLELYARMMEKHPTSKVYLDIFEGGHDMDMEAAMYWLLSQYKKTAKTPVSG